MDTGCANVNLRRKPVATGEAVWSIKLKLLSKQKGKMLTPLTTTLEETYTLISREKSKGQDVNAELSIKDVKVKTLPKVLPFSQRSEET